jgi:TetR/AcrR family tetracycline transcriptional repressor
MTQRRSVEQQPLSRERIVGTALALVDGEGLAALTMRRLGGELGVDPMAIYYHVPNKAALLDGIVEAVMSEIDLSLDDPNRPTDERLICAARAYGDVLLAHVNALPVVLTRGPRTRAALRPVEVMIGILRDGGLSIEEAVAGMNTVAASVRGYVGMMAAEMSAPEAVDMDALREIMSAEEFPHLHEAAARPPQDPIAQYEFGLRALARGLLGA